MAYASLQGRANPNRGAAACCDRCGFVFSHVDLKSQSEWRGPVLQNIQLLVCSTCMDIPQENLRSIAVPADPRPILNARVQDFAVAETDYRALTPSTVTDFVTGLPRPAATLRVTQDCSNRTSTGYSQPLGLEQPAIMPQQLLNDVPTAYGIVLPVLSVSALGTIVTVTCSAVHNLQPGYQVSVLGLTAGNGFYSVEVPTATMFTYQTIVPVAPSLTSQTRIVTANVGLPLGATELQSGY